MLEWKVEEQRLTNDTKYQQELKGMSFEDKVKFIDQFQKGKMSEVLRLIDLFQTDKENGRLKFEQKWNGQQVKTVSLKAWLLKNDTMKLCDNFYKYGHCYFLKDGYIQHITDKEQIVNNRLDMEIVELRREERKYFLEHDEQNILENKLEDLISQYGTMGFNCTTGSSGLLFGTFEQSRKFTIDEMKMLIEQYGILERYKEELAEEIKADLIF